MENKKDWKERSWSTRMRFTCKGDKDTSGEQSSVLHVGLKTMLDSIISYTDLVGWEAGRARIGKHYQGECWPGRRFNF